MFYFPSSSMVCISLFGITSFIVSRFSVPCLQSELVRLSRSIHHSSFLQWKFRDENRLPESEIVDRICRLATLQRFHAIPNLSFKFSNRILNLLLHRLRSNPRASHGVFILASKQQKFRPSLRLYCKIVLILHEGGLLEDARIHMRELLNLCRSRASFARVWTQLVEFNKEISISGSVFDMILMECAEKMMRNHALYVFDYMAIHGPKPSVKSCNCFLSNFVRGGEIDAAFDFFHRMTRIGIFPDVFTCSTMVNAFCKNREFEKAEEFIKKMEKMSVDVNVVAYTCLNNGYFYAWDINSAEGVTYMMEERGIPSNSVAYTSLIKGYVKLGDMEKAERVFGQMLKSSLTLDEHVYGVMIDGFCRNGKMEDAVRLQEEMVRVRLETGLSCETL